MSLNTYTTETAIVPPSDVATGEDLGWMNTERLGTYLQTGLNGHAKSLTTLEEVLNKNKLLGTTEFQSLYFFVCIYDIYGSLTVAVNTKPGTDVDPYLATISVVLPHESNAEFLEPVILASPTNTNTSNTRNEIDNAEAYVDSMNEGVLGFSAMANKLAKESGDSTFYSYDPITFFNYLKSLEHHDLERYLSVYGYGGISEMLDAARAEAEEYAQQLEAIGTEYDGGSGLPENNEGTREGTETFQSIEEFQEEANNIKSQIDEQLKAYSEAQAAGDHEAAASAYGNLQELERQLEELQEAADEFIESQPHEPDPPAPAAEYSQTSLLTDTEYVVTEIPLQTDVENSSLGFAQSIENVIAGSDNVRFDFNSSNIFAEAVEVVADAAQTSVQSYSPLEGLGIVVNRPKILLASDYDIGTNDGIGNPAINNMHNSIDYNNVQHEHVYNFYNTLLIPDIGKLTDLETAYADRITLCINSIQFIRTIDEFKTNFINEITNFNKYGLQILGYTNGLNSTRAIRQAFYDVAHLNETGGYFIYHKLRDVFETADTVGLSKPDIARIIDTNFQPGYRVIAGDQSKLVPAMTSQGEFTIAAFLDDILKSALEAIAPGVSEGMGGGTR